MAMTPYVECCPRLYSSALNSISLIWSLLICEHAERVLLCNEENIIKETSLENELKVLMWGFNTDSLFLKVKGKKLNKQTLFVFMTK